MAHCFEELCFAQARRAFNNEKLAFLPTKGFKGAGHLCQLLTPTHQLDVLELVNGCFVKHILQGYLSGVHIAVSAPLFRGIEGRISPLDEGLAVFGIFGGRSDSNAKGDLQGGVNSARLKGLLMDLFI